jgi:Fe-S-cluster-containing hydrogenase component 2
MASAAGNHTFKLVIDDTTCRRCGRCPAGDTCRGNAFIRYERDESPFIDMSRCWGCLKCVIICPFGAVTRLDYSQPSPAIP